MGIRLESPAFPEGGTIPRKHTCDGEDISPPLAWSNVPKAARSFVLIADDPDAPGGTWTHWVLHDLPADVRGLPEGVPPGPTVTFALVGTVYTAKQGRNDFKKPGYGGPCPPSGTHRYFFRLYALDIIPSLGPETTRQAVLRAIQGHILAEGSLMGRYSRDG